MLYLWEPKNYAFAHKDDTKELRKLTFPSLPVASYAY